MWLLENKCDECFGHIVLDEEELTATCEDCGKTVKVKNRETFAEFALDAVEYGEKEKRLEPTPVGKLFLEPFNGLSVFLRETLVEATKGLELEDAELAQLVKWGLIDSGSGAES